MEAISPANRVCSLVMSAFPAGRRLVRHRMRRLSSLLLGFMAVVAYPASAAAHPLGNFTINHFATVRIEPKQVLLDVVVDQAEIPAFQARAGIDTDADGQVSDAEIEASRTTACLTQAEDLFLTIGARRLDVRLIEAGLSFPPGVGGLATMRLVCAYDAQLPEPIADGVDSRLTFRDESFRERLGWREIVVVGSGVTVRAAEGALRATSVSDRLSVYPDALVASPLADTIVSIDATLGGPTLPVFEVPDALPVGDRVDPTPSGAEVSAMPSPTASAPPGVVPGGIGGEGLPAIFSSADLTPVIVLVSLLTAAGLGAAHALTPGHGKTLMAAYLVGMRGTPRHAVGLGLSVSISHTVGILILAALVVGATDVLPADLVVRIAPLVAAISIVLIGAWMVIGEVGRRRSVAPEGAPRHSHGETDHEHEAEHEHEHEAEHEHSHGGIRHSHLPEAGTRITWRSLFVLGLAGGLIPSTSALLILLGSIAAGRPAFGFVLVVAFGLGMAAVMGGIGLVMVLARGRLDTVGTHPAIGRFVSYVPLVAAFLVLGLGSYLMVQAISAAPTF